MTENTPFEEPKTNRVYCITRKQLIRAGLAVVGTVAVAGTLIAVLGSDKTQKDEQE